MTKKRSSSHKGTKSTTQFNPLLIVGIVAALAVVIVGAVLLSSPAAAPALEGASQEIGPVAYTETFSVPGEDHILIDVRTPDEFASGHIAGAVNIPVEEIADRLDEVPQDKPVVLYCRSGNRSNQASGILVNAGFTGIYDLGGINAWEAAGLPIE
jgi:rhodanese-related sulfurtransferase